MFTHIFHDSCLLEPLALDYQNHPIIKRFGSPNQSIYIHPSFELDNGHTMTNAMILPLYDSSMQMCQVAVLQDDSHVLFFDGEQVKHNPSYFALFGHELPNNNDDIFITFHLEHAFKLASCGYHVACVLSDDSCKQAKAQLSEMTERKQKQLIKRITKVVKALNRAGYHHLYFPLQLADIELDTIQQLSQNYMIQLLPLLVQDGHGGEHIIGLCKDEPCDDIHTVIELGLAQALSKLQKGHLAPIYHFENGFFKVTQNGVFHVSHDKENNQIEMFISSPILIRAETRDESGHNWGRLFEWKDRDGRIHQQALSMELFQTDGAELRKVLSNAGVTISPSSKARLLLSSYLMCYPMDKKALCVERTGWHGSQYTMPHKVVGESSELIVYQSYSNISHAYSAKGELSQWQQYIAMPCNGHDKLVFALCTAFAGALLQPLNINDGQCYHFKGLSSKGKSTALRVASSVWGKASDFIRTWRATGNALENTAYLHNDGFLALDEIGQISKPKELGEIAYMLCNGQGKARSSREIINRPIKRWRLIVLSSGERTLKDILNEAGQQAKLGQEIRLIDIDVDHSHWGIFDNVDFANEASEQADLLNRYSNDYFGVAGEAWLDYLTMDYEQTVQQAKSLYDEYKQTLQANTQESHIKRVASQFALLAVAGEMASRANITTWQTGRALQAVQNVFDEWLSNFEYKGNYQEIQILKQVRAFLEQHGSSRFESIDGNGEKIYNRAGYFKMNGGEKIYLVNSTVFENEICKGLNRKNVIKVLKNAGWLATQGERDNVMHRVHDQQRTVRLYTFTGKAITDDLDNLSDMGKFNGNSGNIDYNTDCNHGNSVTRYHSLETDWKQEKPFKINNVTNVTTVTKEKPLPAKNVEIEI